MTKRETKLGIEMPTLGYSAEEIPTIYNEDHRDKGYVEAFGTGLLTGRSA